MSYICQVLAPLAPLYQVTTGLHKVCKLQKPVRHRTSSFVLHFILSRLRIRGLHEDESVVQENTATEIT